MHSDRGQGTVEYLAVVLLVTVALGGGTAAVAKAAGADVATAVPHQLIRALCIVTGGDCDRDRAPCPVGSSTASNSWSVTVAVVHLGRNRVLVRERRSDGSETVTLTTVPSIGLQTVEGAGGRIDRGRRGFSLGGGLTASVIASLGRGRTWVLPNREAADALVVALEHDRDVPLPDQVLGKVDLAAGVTASRSGARSGVDATGSVTAGVRGSVARITDKRTGGHTDFLEGGADAVLELSARLSGLRAAASASSKASARIALTVDGDGRWVDLVLLGAGEVSGTATLPKSAGPVADALNVQGSGGRRWVAEAHLDLSDAGNLAAAKRLVAGVRAVPPKPAAVAGAAADLARRIDERAVVDLRTYALDRNVDGFEVHAGDGVGLGVGHESSTENTRLIGATTRGLDGQWRRRDDCFKEEDV
jgi:hypothetical protein